ncbi:hypothetical protein Tco_1489226, partial [Tanacetum coccineum]
MPPNRTSISATPAMTQAAIRQLVASIVPDALLVPSVGLSKLNQYFLVATIPRTA